MVDTMQIYTPISNCALYVAPHFDYNPWCNQRCAPTARQWIYDICFLPMCDAYGIVEFIVLRGLEW